MRIALIGATGNVGQRVLAELRRRNHAVTAIARNPHALDGQAGVTPRAGDVGDPDALATLLADHDAVISSVCFRGTDPHAIIAAVRKAGVTRLIVVGGAGSLLLPDGTRLVDSPNFPEAYRQEALRGAAFLDILRATDDLDWTFISPAALFVPGERTGTFRLGDDRLLVNADAISTISYEDYAVGLVDELERPAHIRRRFTVSY